MARVKRGTTIKQRHKKILKLAKGYRGRAKNCYTPALQRVEKALQYAYRDRRNRKRDLRRLWICRINAAAREHGLTYSQFMHGMVLAGIDVNRKILAELAFSDQACFKQIFDTVCSKLNEHRAVA